VITYINNTYDGRNLAGVLIATDGIYNRGANPIYTPIGHSAPIHFLALGDTTVRRDLILRRVLHNRVAYLGEKFSFQIDLSAQMANGASTELRVFSFSADGSSNLIHSEEVNIDSDDFFKTFEVVTEATETRPATLSSYRQSNRRRNSALKTTAGIFMSKSWTTEWKWL
jgi:hypothetical protein